VEDEAAIRALVVAYAERLDAGDLEGVAGLFERGVFRSTRGGEPRVGAEAVRAMYDGVIIHDDGTPHTKHVLGNILIDVDESGARATSRCTFTVLQPVDGRVACVLAGRYHDTFVRDGDGWHFEERLVHPDLIGDLSLHMGRS
jgi:hypothetical protein